MPVNRGSQAKMAVGIATAILVTSLVVAAIVVWVGLRRDSEATVESDRPKAAAVHTEQQELSDSVPESGTTVWKGPAVAVVVDNSPPARPQSGLAKAEIVIEALAEGGVPRYLAIFDGGDKERRVGPVRSARPYLVLRGLEYGGLFVHCGGSPEALGLLSKLAGSRALADVDEMKGYSGFVRDRSRKAPHNLYADLGAVAGARKGEGRSDHPLAASFSLAGSGEAAPESWEGEDCGRIDVSLSRNHDITYEYDGKNWLRSVRGKPDVDAESGERLSAATVVIQEVPYRVVDDVGRLEMDVVGGGEALIAYQGRKYLCKWRKDSPASPTVFYRGADYTSRFALDGGPVWMELVRPGTIARLGGGDNGR